MTDASTPAIGRRLIETLDKAILFDRCCGKPLLPDCDGIRCVRCGWYPAMHDLALAREALRACDDALAPHDRDMICEQHPELLWPHGECAGPGCPLSAREGRQWHMRRELQQAALVAETRIQDGLTRIRQLEADALAPAPDKWPFDFVKRLQTAQDRVRNSSLYRRFIDGTPLENDIAVWMTEFAAESVYWVREAWQLADRKQSEMFEQLEACRAALRGDDVSASIHPLVHDIAKLRADALAPPEPPDVERWRTLYRALAWMVNDYIGVTDWADYKEVDKRLGYAHEGYHNARRVMREHKPPMPERLQRFNDGTACLSGGNSHPDRCVCQEKETGVYAGTPHKHYDEPPYSCARCHCKAYKPALPAPPRADALDASRTDK